MRERGRTAVASLLLLLAALGAGAAGAERAMTIDASVDGVEFAGRGTVSVVTGDEPSVQLQARKQALLDEYDMEVRDGTLVIERRERRSLRDRLFDRDHHDDQDDGVVVEIVLAAVDRVDFAGAGELNLAAIRSDRLTVTLSGAGACALRDLDVEDLELKISGAGSCSASGSAGRQRVKITGAGDFDAEALASRIVTVELSGAADASFRVSEELDATVSGSGSIAYRGAPVVRQQVSGFGSISRLD